MPSSTELVWYASYGSNMDSSRLRHYLAGGTPPDGLRGHPGARDPRPPRASRGITVPGEVYFAQTSSLWGGGIAFYDRELPGVAAGRAHLLTIAQFSDVVAQEMRRDPGQDLDLSQVLATGRDELGSGWYDTLLHLGDLDGHPLLTFTAAWSADEVPVNAPTAPYLRMLGRGLGEAHDWEPAEVSAYLSQLRGARGHWPHGSISSLLAEAA